MKQTELQTRASMLEQKIAALPAGSIGTKTINGKTYFYHRWTENKKSHEKYLPAQEVETMRTQIEQRKLLEKELKELKKQLPTPRMRNHSVFSANVRTDAILRSFPQMSVISVSVNVFRRCMISSMANRRTGFLFCMDCAVPVKQH